MGREEWLGEMFEGAGLETGSRAGRELKELVIILKQLAILLVPLSTTPERYEDTYQGWRTSPSNKVLDITKETKRQSCQHCVALSCPPTLRSHSRPACTAQSYAFTFFNLSTFPSDQL